MMKCEITDRDQRIDDFLQAKLSPEEADTFEIHLFGCSECLEELRLREQMVSLVKNERVTAVADYPSKRMAEKRQGVINSIVDFLRLQQNIWIYAGATAVLVIGLVITQVWRQRESSERYAANFTESRRLESILQQTYQSDDFSISVFSPQIGANFSGQIEFRWEIKKAGQTFRGPLVLKILNNQEVTVHTVTVENGQYACKEKLAPGLYYWTLDDNGETVYIGKFFVKKF